MLVALSIACTTNRELSGVTPYSDMIGRTYRIVGEVSASGIYTNGERPDYMMLHPRSQVVSGPEVAFTRPVPVGQTFRIVGAWMFDTPIDDTIYYVVELAGNPLSPGLPVRLPLDYNPHVNGDLNQLYYERVK